MKLRNKKQENRIREFNKAFSFSSFFIYFGSRTRESFWDYLHIHIYTHILLVLKEKKKFQ